jgi:hypothetical protein
LPLVQNDEIDPDPTQAGSSYQLPTWYIARLA